MMMEVLKKKMKYLKRSIKTKEVKVENKMLLKRISDMKALIDTLCDNKQKLTEENRTLKQDLEREKRMSEEKTESLRMIQAEGRRKEAELRDMERSLNISNDYIDRNLDLSIQIEELSTTRERLASRNYKCKQEIKRLKGLTRSLKEAQEEDQKTIKNQINLIIKKEKIIKRKSKNLSILLNSIKENISGPHNPRLTPEVALLGYARIVP